jgi:hypothetical protein
LGDFTSLQTGGENLVTPSRTTLMGDVLRRSLSKFPCIVEIWLRDRNGQSPPFPKLTATQPFHEAPVGNGDNEEKPAREQ